VDRRLLGAESEQLAVKYLKSRGYKIVCINWTCYAGEIDIVALKNNLIFIEVKSAKGGFCSPCEMFTHKKKKHLERSINIFLEQNFKNKNVPEYRLDLICIFYFWGIGSKHLYHYKNILNTLV
jgi:putative endonuclease